MDLDLAIRLPQEAETVGLIRAVLTNTLDLLGVEKECVEDIRLAVSEACSNVLDHAADDDEYEVRVDLDDMQCAISVTNTAGFDAASLADEMPNIDSPRGRGVAIMRAVMDRITFVSEPASGTIVHLVKTLVVEPGGPLDRLRSSRPGTEAATG